MNVISRGLQHIREIKKFRQEARAANQRAKQAQMQMGKKTLSDSN